MSVLWRKVIFDLWSNKARTLLAVISIAAGLVTVGGIFGLLDQLLSSMDAAHRAVQPSHVNIILRSYVDQAVVDDLKKTPGVVNIDPVNQISVRYKLNADDTEWKIGTVVERPDYGAQTYDQLELKGGNWPSGLNLAVERLTSEHWGVAPGDKVLLEIDGKAREFEIDGLVRHPFVQPPPFGGQAHFFASAEGLAEFGVPEGRFGQLLVRVDNYSLARSQEIAGELRQRLGDKGYGVVVTLYQDPERHWGRKFLEGVNLVLQIMAVVSLLMSVILVLNVFTALITQQTDQIGVIKAIGGQSGNIVRLYLAGALILGALALLVAIPIGAAFAFYMAQTYLRLFNIDYETFQLSRNALLITSVAAFAAPVLAALWPTLKGASISVRQAIATYGIGADFGSSPLDRGVERIGGALLPPAYASALGNLFRRKGRLALTVLVLAVAGAMFLVVMSLISSIERTLDNDMARRGYDVKIGFAGERPADEVLRVAEETAGVRSAETWYSRNATILRQNERLQDSAGLGAQLTGVPPQTTMQRPLVVEGRWLAPEDGRAVVMSAETAGKNNIKLGDEVTLNLAELGEAKWKVVGLYRVVYDTGFVVEPIYAPLDAMLDATGKSNVASQVLIKTDDATLAGAKKVSDDLRAKYEDAGIKVDFYTTALKQEERDYAANQFSTVVGMLIGLAALVATVGGIGLAGSLSIGVVERTREIGVLRAIGARSRTLMGIFVMEGTLQGLMSWAIALPISFALAQPLARLMGQVMLNIDLDFSYNWAAVAVWLGVVIGIAICAAMFPAQSATKISVRQALAYS
jgi:putative ABC transport system permease protein